MVAAAMDAMADADAILLILDATHGVTPTVRQIAASLQQVAERRSQSADIKDDQDLKPEACDTPSLCALRSATLFAVINKTDAVRKQDLLPIAAELSELAPFKEIFMVSALKNDGIGKMLESLATVMPESPYLFAAADAPDVPDELYLAELTREKIYKYIHQELPYHIYVETEKVDVDPDGVLEIYQKIVVANENHKKIIVGKGGAQLKKIGTEARHDIQDQWGVNARLRLFVRVEPDWEDKRENYETQGLEFNK
jgi:GTP-binding protein Era